IDDLVSIIMTCLVNEKIIGPVNACAPNPVTNQEFTEKLASCLHKPSILKVPSPFLRAAVGEVAQALLSSQRTIPDKLKSLNFYFKYPRIDLALRAIFADSYALGYNEFLGQSWISKPIEEVFEFFASASNLEAITPPWLKFKVLSQSTSNLQKGTLIKYGLKLHGLPMKWKTEISQWNPPLNFVDTQLQGPYNFWQHTHSFRSLNGGTLIEDRILYRLPMGIVGGLLAGPFVKNDIKQIFAYRSKKIFEALSLRL
ncbi:MAG: DUF1731 domain-containing protein, partial [Bdellovibrionia bacterium]